MLDAAAEALAGLFGLVLLAAVGWIIWAMGV